jgi:uncharacterized lipoprotein YmbA
MTMAKPSLMLIAGALLAGTLTSCINLKRADQPAHFYTLSAAPTNTTPLPIAEGDLPVGLGPMEIPSYLLDRRIALCRGPHEINYLEYDRWAERLDKGIQRVVAANLASVLPSDRVLRSAWRRDEVAAEVYISMLRFESDEEGRVIVEAHWRITSPGGEATWKADHIRLDKQGPAFRVDPGGAVEALSHALADLTEQVAADLRDNSTHAMVSKPDPTLGQAAAPSSGLARRVTVPRSSSSATKPLKD